MPLTARMVHVETGKLRLLGPTSTNKGIFILDEYPKLDNQVTGATKMDDPFLAGRILPTSDLYKSASYRLEMHFAADYPFKPPKVRFATPIYHLNVDKDGVVCLPIMRHTEEWKATTSLADVVRAVVDVIDNPRVEYAMNPEILKEYQENKPEYERKAREMVAKDGKPRT